MDGEVFDNMKNEKAKAMARFKRFQRIKKFCKVLIIVMLFWSLKNIPVPVGFSGKVLFRVSGYALNTHVAFLIGNAIIVVLFLLCRKGGVGNSSGENDLYDDYVRHSEAQRRVGSGFEIETETEMEKIVKEDNGGVGGGKAEEKEMQTVVTKNDQCEAVESAIAKATKQIQKFERTQSEKLRREITAKPQKELRRSETQTEMQPQLVYSSDENMRSVQSSVERVNSLSNEEFKLAIDDYIVKHREFFYKQKLQDLKQFNKLYA